MNFCNSPLPSQNLIRYLRNLNSESLIVQAQCSPAESSDNLQPFEEMSRWVWNSDIWFNHLFDPIWFHFVWLQMHRQGTRQKRIRTMNTFFLRCTDRVHDKGESEPWILFFLISLVTGLSHLEKKRGGIYVPQIWQHHGRKNDEWLTWALAWKKTWESEHIRAI